MGYEWLQIALDRLRGIEPAEVLEALRASRRMPVPGDAAGIAILGVFARTTAGRPLVVVVRKTSALDQQIVGPGR